MKWLPRITVILLLALAIWNPNLPWGRADTDVFVLLDDSYSMEDKLTPKLWAQVRRQILALSANSQMALIRYGKEVVQELPLTPINQLKATTTLYTELPPRNLPLDRTASNLEKALSFASRLIRPGHQTAILIIHDGRQNQGHALERLEKLKQQGHALFQLNLADTKTQGDVWVEGLTVPLYAEAGQALPISVTLGSNAPVAAELTIDVNGKQSHRQLISLEAGRRQTLPLTVEACRQEVCIVSAELSTTATDAIPLNNTRRETVTIDIAKPALYLYDKPSPPPLLASLLNGRYPVETLTPKLCMGSAAELRAYRSIVIDDLAIADMPFNCWTAIEKAVRREGLGLIVLGGPNSFSAGAYRHSLLETLLPVTAEASAQQENATLLFVIDKSGSMDTGTTNKMSLARQAVIETLKSQTGEDRFGLISFDARPHLTIPIRHYADPAAIVAETFNSQAAGGTRLKPALDFALDQLNGVDSGKRILVLVTDGFLDEQDLLSVEQRLNGQSIEIIVMAIGDDAKTQNLQRLTDNGRGKLLHVDKLAELPLLMRKTLDERRLPAVDGKTEVIPVRPLPFMPENTSWPPLSGYILTRAKPEGTVYLRSQQGDPLLVTGQAGLGNVIALPAGLDSWARNWASNWHDWSRFSGGLIHWSSGNTDHHQLQASLKSGNTLEINAISADQGWLSLESGTLTISAPDGRTQSQPMRLAAPGQYLTTLEFQTPGLHTLTVKLGELGRTLNVFYNAGEEYLPDPKNTGLPETALIPTWDPFTAIPLENSANSSRILLPGTALLFYLIVVWLETAPNSRTATFKFAMSNLPILGLWSLRGGSAFPRGTWKRGQSMIQCLKDYLVSR